MVWRYLMVSCMSDNLLLLLLKIKIPRDALATRAGFAR